MVGRIVVLEGSWEMDVKSWPPKEEAQLQPVDFSCRSFSVVSFQIHQQYGFHNFTKVTANTKILALETRPVYQKEAKKDSFMCMD